MKKEYDAISIGFRVDTMGLLTEVVDCAMPKNMGILKIPLNIFKNILEEVAQRATELNDPQLNILMLKLALYEVPAREIREAIEKQMELKDKQEKEYNRVIKNLYPKTKRK